MLDSFFRQRQGQNKVPDFSSWLAELDEQQQKWQMTFPKFDNSVTAPQLTIQMLGDLTGGNGVISTGVGQHQMWAVQRYRYKKLCCCLTSGGLFFVTVSLTSFLRYNFCLLQWGVSYQCNSEEVA